MLNSLEDVLQKIYDSEINLRIEWFFDRGVSISLGDDVNGFVAEIFGDNLMDAVDGIIRVILEIEPDSDFSKEWEADFRFERDKAKFIKDMFKRIGMGK